jgi:hypothetical protein
MDDTKNKDCSFNAFTVAIAGSWINPHTNNRYIFTPDPGNHTKGEVYIKQQGLETAIPLRISLRKGIAGIEVLVENSVYPVTFLENPEETLIIEVEPVGIIRLIRTAP